MEDKNIKLPEATKEQPAQDSKQKDSSSSSFITINDISQREKKLLEIINKSKKKLIETKPGLFLRPKNFSFSSDEYKSLFLYESQTEKIFNAEKKEQYGVIFDCLNFITFDKIKTEFNKEKNISNLKNLYTITKQKGGVLLILLDEPHLTDFFQNFLQVLESLYPEKATNENEKIEYPKLFLNFYFIDVLPTLFLFSIQNLSTQESPVSYSSTKVLITDYFTRPYLYSSSQLGQFHSFLTPLIKKIYAYRETISSAISSNSKLHNGSFSQVKLKNTPLKDEITYIFTIYDNPFGSSLSNKNVNTGQCMAIILSYEYCQEFLYSKQQNFSNMCLQLKAARLIIIEAAPLNTANAQMLPIELANLIKLFKPTECKQEEVPIRLWEDHNQKNVILFNNEYLIRDSEDNKQLNTRQFYLMDNKNYLQTAIRTKLASKKNINKPAKGMYYFPIETDEKYKKKGIIQCLDESCFLGGFYEKSLMCTVYYLNLFQLPETKFHTLVIGGGTGMMCFYFYKLLKGAVYIDSVEKNKKIYELGKSHFGFKNFEEEYSNNEDNEGEENDKNVKWYLEDANIFLNKVVSNYNKPKTNNNKNYVDKCGYYDLIFNEVNDMDPKEMSSPGKGFFEDEFLKNICLVMKPFGIYCVNVMCKNDTTLWENYLQLEKYFKNIFTIHSDGKLSNIFYCFKEKIEVSQYAKKFENNKSIIESGERVDFSLIKPFWNQILARVEDMQEERKRLEDNAKQE